MTYAADLQIANNFTAHTRDVFMFPSKNATNAILNRRNDLTKPTNIIYKHKAE